MIVHSSLKSLGKVVGGPVAVILALEEVVGMNGNIVMPTQTEHLCEPTEFWIVNTKSDSFFKG